MHHVNNMVIMQTEQLGWIKTLEEKLLVIGHYFGSYFRPFSTQLHTTFLTPPFSFMLTPIMFIPLCPLCFSHSRTINKNTI